MTGRHCPVTWLGQSPFNSALKHNNNQRDGMVGEFDAWLMITRAITKYRGAYGEKPRKEIGALVELGQA